MPTVRVMVVMSAPQVHITNQKLLTMTSLNSKLQLAMLNRKKGQNLIEKFTLIELLITVVILGTLSSVAVPGFIAQKTGPTSLQRMLKAALMSESWRLRRAKASNLTSAKTFGAVTWTPTVTHSQCSTNCMRLSHHRCHNGTKLRT